jgi:murein L,D-transpeptidase YcbB/YkuD
MKTIVQKSACNKMTALLKLVLAFGLIAFPSTAGSLPVIDNPLINQEPSVNDGGFKDALSSLKDPSDEDTIAFYEKMGREPVWFFQGNLTKCGHIAVETLKDAAEDGLTPHDYEDATHTAHKPGNWVDAEILLTKRYLEFITHIRSGRIDPSRISRDIKFPSPKTHSVALLLDAIQDKSTECRKLRHMAPAIPQYAHLKKILATWRELAKNTKEWPTIKEAKTLKIGEEHPERGTLRQILTLYGDLKEGSNPSSTFDPELDTALRQFQKRHTLEPDGIVGAKTKDALNQSIHDRIRQVIYNMERLRWLPEDLGEKYIIVNVAGYQVQAYEKSDLKLTIPAIVGRPSRRTPLFYAPLRNIIVNPSWGVPYTILVHDKLPKIINDPDYIRRSGFTVMDHTGNVVNPDEADWENEGIHYHLRQSPGARNALGRVKFNIENPYTIYIHGSPTSDEKLFHRTARAFSSGCIRLKTPEDLAVWILNNENKWSHEHIEKAIHKGATQTIKPEEDISVFFTYQTVWMGEDNLISISDDPYRIDRKMEQVLNPKA